MKRKSVVIQLRVTPAAIKAWRALARKNEMSLSDWIRRKCSGWVGDGNGYFSDRRPK